MMRPMRFDEKLRRLCQRRGLTQAQLMRAVGASKSTMSNWFNGKNKPDLETALKMARFLDVPLEYLADDALEEPPPGLSEEKRRALWLLDQMPLDEAIRRLMAVPQRPAAAPSVEPAAAPAGSRGHIAADQRTPKGRRPETAG
jgi:transcriptional regulator with XRE-family HTH domain